jgi:hypothetical protein
MGPIDCPETSVTNYLSTLRNIPEGRRSHLYRSESLKSSNSFSSLTIYTTFCVQQFGSEFNALFWGDRFESQVEQLSWVKFLFDFRDTVQENAERYLTLGQTASSNIIFSSLFVTQPFIEAVMILNPKVVLK